MNAIDRKPSKTNPNLNEVSVLKGTVLFEEGDPASTMYIVQSGAIDISLINGRISSLLSVLEKALESKPYSVLNFDSHRDRGGVIKLP